MATCTMAKVRSLGLLPTSLATRASVVAFQSVTTSAHAGATHSAAATMPGSRTTAGFLGIAFMAGSLYGHEHRKLPAAPLLMHEVGRQVAATRPRANASAARDPPETRAVTEN